MGLLVLEGPSDLGSWVPRDLDATVAKVQLSSQGTFPRSSL